MSLAIGFRDEIASSGALFDELGCGLLSFDEVRAATDEPNVASVAVLERLGMRPWKVRDGEPYRTLFYRLSVDDWCSTHGGGAVSSARK